MEDNVLKEILSKLNSLDEKISNLDERISSIEAGQSNMAEKLDILSEQSINLKDYRVTNYSQMSTLQKDVNYIKYKLQRNEEEFFYIKNRMVNEK